MKKFFKILIIVIIIIGGLIGLLSYLGNQMFSDMGECGMSAGPIYGDTIQINTDSITIEQFIEIPNGKFGLINLTDSISPKIIRFDTSGEILWTLEFKEDSLIGIPFHNISEMELVKETNNIRLTFFNNSYSEPGRIYLTDDYEVEFMCLSPM